jgi:hypothetical protein
MLSFRNKVIEVVVKLWFAISFPRMAFQRAPVRVNHPFITRRPR